MLARRQRVLQCQEGFFWPWERTLNCIVLWQEVFAFHLFSAIELFAHTSVTGPSVWIVFLPVNHGKLIRMHFTLHLFIQRCGALWFFFLVSSIMIRASFLSQYLIALITSIYVRNNDVDLILILCSRVRWFESSRKYSVMIFSFVSASTPRRDCRVEELRRMKENFYFSHAPSTADDLDGGLLFLR